MYDGEIIVLEETATEKQFVDILNAVKSIERKVDETKLQKFPKIVRIDSCGGSPPCTQSV